MTDHDRPPLREGDTGSFVELAARPNPEALVVRHVFSFERTLVSVRDELGRNLTDDEIETRRGAARAIAVTSERDQAMTLAEAGARRQTIDNHR